MDRFTLAAPASVFREQEVIAAGHALVERFNRDDPEIRLALFCGRGLRKRLDALQQEDPAGYVHFTELHEGKGHWMNLEDRKAIPWMEKFTRTPLPDRVVWFQDDVTRLAFYWLAVPPGQPKAGQQVTAVRQGQTVTLAGKGVPTVTVLLNDAMLDLDQPVTIKDGERNLFEGRLTRTIATLARTLAERADTNLTFSASTTVTLP